MKSLSTLYAALPHGQSFQCVKEIVSANDEELHCRILFDSGSVFESDDGKVFSSAIIEAVAQVAALGTTIKNQYDSRKEGVIVKVQRFSTTTEYLRTQTMYDAVVSCHSTLRGILDVHGHFTHGAERCGEVSMMILQKGVSQ